MISKEAQQALGRLAVLNAIGVIKAGDKISAHGCAGTKRHFKFTHWDGSWLCGKNINDVHPINVYKINGKPVNFKGE